MSVEESQDECSPIHYYLDTKSNSLLQYIHPTPGHGLTDWQHTVALQLQYCLV